jgi:hypothetical protein
MPLPLQLIVLCPALLLLQLLCRTGVVGEA